MKHRQTFSAVALSYHGADERIHYLVENTPEEIEKKI